MTENCVFCRIIRGELPSTRICEDERAIAFMDNRPISEGHSLIVSKKHYESIFDIPVEELAYLVGILKKVAVALNKSEGPDGIRIIQNNGVAANQVVFHFHIHVIPVYKGRSSIGLRRTQPENALEIVAGRIRGFI